MLLAIDTSTRTAGIALYNGVQVLTEITWTSHDYHTVELAPVIAQALARCGLKAASILAVGVAIGPGSFTGLRIGLALAKGLVLERRIPLLGVPTLDILAAAQPVLPVPLLAALQAGRSRLAVGAYQARDGAWHADGLAQVCDIQALSQRIQHPTLVCGELTAEERRILARKRKNVLLASPASSHRRPGFLAELAWKRFEAGEADNPASLSPIYLHVGEPIPG